MVLLILAGGFSTRLEPRTLETPKQLLPIGARYFIDFFMDSIAPAKDEFSKTVIVTNSKYIDSFTQWSSNSPWPIEIICDGVVDKSHKIGAIGDLLFALDKGEIGDDVLICAPDFILAEFDFKKFIESTKNSRHSWTIAKEEPDIDQIRAGSCLLLDSRDKVIRFEEKPEDPFSSLYGVPYYFLKRSDFKFIKNIPNNLRDNSGQIVAQLVKDSIVCARRYDGQIMHMTSEQDYQQILKSHGF